MTHEGKPKWNGKIADIDLHGCVFAWGGDKLGPCLMLLEGCSDDEPFCPIFSTPEKLHAHMDYLTSRGMGLGNYSIKQVDDPADFMGSLREAGVRLMYDPRIINDHHTKWHEIVYAGEEWMFVDSEAN